jgi:hypothetical protein
MFNSFVPFLKNVFNFVFLPINLIYEKIEDFGYYLRDKKGYQQDNLAFIAGLPFASFVILICLIYEKYLFLSLFTLLIFTLKMFPYSRFKVSDHLKLIYRATSWFVILHTLILLTYSIYWSSMIILYASMISFSLGNFLIWWTLDKTPPKRKNKLSESKVTLKPLTTL